MSAKIYKFPSKYKPSKVIENMEDLYKHVFRLVVEQSHFIVNDITDALRHRLNDDGLPFNENNEVFKRDIALIRAGVQSMVFRLKGFPHQMQQYVDAQFENPPDIPPEGLQPCPPPENDEGPKVG